MPKTAFDLCEKSQPLRSKLWLNRRTDEYWRLLRECDSRVIFQPPATDAQIATLKEYAGGTIPACLEEFLRCANGLRFHYDDILFSAEMIINETESIRHLEDEGIHMPIDHLLFIGGSGDGDAFAFGKQLCGEWTSNVYWWDHEDDSRYSCASDTYDYVGAHVAWWHFNAEVPDA
jgi:hypothetical protein